MIALLRNDGGFVVKLIENFWKERIEIGSEKLELSNYDRSFVKVKKTFLK